MDIDIIIDREPAPDPHMPHNSNGLRAAVKSLTPGQSMLVRKGCSYNSIKVTVSRIKKETPGSLWTVRKVGMGDVRVWRLA